jgi:molecular chaperone Hsp33
MLFRGHTRDGQFRLFAVRSTQTIQTARDLHDLSPIATILMGRLITAAALMSLELKAPGSELTLRVEGDGLLKGATVTATQTGKVRGYAFEPALFLEDNPENFKPGKHLGKGILTVSRHLPDRSPQQGHTNLVTGGIAEDLAHYYLQSEQLPTAINLGILIGKDAQIRAGGGFMIQQLPQADPKAADKLIANLGATPNVSDLMDMGLDMPDILNRFVFKEMEFELTESHPLRYHCPCSKQRFAKALRLLGREELLDLAEGISPICHYCNKQYRFEAEDMYEIIRSLGENK